MLLTELPRELWFPVALLARVTPLELLLLLALVVPVGFSRSTGVVAVPSVATLVEFSSVAMIPCLVKRALRSSIVMSFDANCFLKASFWDAAVAAADWNPAVAVPLVVPVVVRPVVVEGVVVAFLVAPRETFVVVVGVEALGFLVEAEVSVVFVLELLSGLGVTSVGTVLLVLPLGSVMLMLVLVGHNGC